MENNSFITSYNKTSTSSTIKDFPSQAQEGVSLVSAFIFESVMIVGGNLLTIILFVREKKLRKKSLFLVMNMAFADVMLGAVSLPLFVYLLVGPYYHLWAASKSTFNFYLFHFLDVTFSQSSLISAVFISCERFYAVYWPLKHKTLSTRAYGFVIFMVWSLAIVISIAYHFSFYPESYKAAILSWMIFLLSFLFIVCACNIGIWRKVRKRNIALPQQNRAASQNQRLTKTLLFVSAISVVSWLPLVIVNYLTFFRQVDIPNVFVNIINILNFSNSILNPFIYALRIPQFRQILVLCCSRRQAIMNGQGKEERANIAAFLKPALQLRSSHPESSQVQQTSDRQKVMDTKL